MIWINFLHFYQPVNTDAHVIKEATEKSYYRIIRALEENPHTKFTININACLFYRFEELGYLDLALRMKKLIKKGQLEVTGNAAYHPLLPLIEKEEIKKQIKETEKLLKKFLGLDLKPKGFFMSEMAYSSEVAKIVKKQGYEWIILDEISNTGKLNETDFEKFYKDEESNLKVIFRSREFSNSFVPKTIKKLSEENKTEVCITATDGELYGLRHIDHTAEFEKIMKNSESFKTLTISEYFETAKDYEKVSLKKSNWESLEKEIEENKPYHLWYNKKNEIQTSLWSLARLAYKAIEGYSQASSEQQAEDDNYYWARWHMVRGLASCTFWWASGKDFAHNFGPLAWNPDEIERGVNEFIRGIRALENENTRETKMKAEKLYIDIKKKIWEQHWTYYWKRNN